MLEELFRDRLAMDALRHGVVRLVAQRAHDFGREYLVEDLDDLLAVGLIRLGNRTFIHMLACAPPDLVEVCLEGVHMAAALQELSLCKAAKDRIEAART